MGGGWEILEQQLRKRLWEQEREMADQLDRIEVLNSLCRRDLGEIIDCLDHSQLKWCVCYRTETDQSTR